MQQEYTLLQAERAAWTPSMTDIFGPPVEGEVQKMETSLARDNAHFECIDHHLPQGKNVQTAPNASGGPATSTKGDTVRIDIKSTQKALEDMKCYIDFVNKELIPKYRMFEGADNSRQTKVRFTDLWSLFRPGELVLQPTDDSDMIEEDTNSPRANTRGPRLWRVFFNTIRILYRRSMTSTMMIPAFSGVIWTLAKKRCLYPCTTSITMGIHIPKSGSV